MVATAITITNTSQRKLDSNRGLLRGAAGEGAGFCYKALNSGIFFSRNGNERAESVECSSDHKQFFGTQLQCTMHKMSLLASNS